MSAPLTRGGRRPKLTSAQWANLRYWAGCSIDQPGYPAASGPAPTMQPRTLASLATHGWAWQYRDLLIVTDRGRRMADLPPVWRDRACPLRGCQAAPGERCRDLHTLIHIDRTHQERAGIAPADPVPLAPALTAYHPDEPVGYILAT